MMTKDTRTLEIRVNPARQEVEFYITKGGLVLSDIKLSPEQTEAHVRNCLEALKIARGGRKSAILVPGDPGFKAN